MSAKRRTDGRAECRSRRYARLAVIAVAAGMLMASGAAVAGDYYVRGGSRRCSPLIRFKQKAKGRNKVASSTWLRVSLACFGTQLPMRLRSIGTWYAPTPRICSPRYPLSDIPHIPSKFVEIVPLSHRQGNCIPYAAIRWHDFGNRPALGRPLGHFSRHPDTPLLSLSPRRRFPRPTPERVFVADHQSSSGFSGTGPSAPPPQPIGT